MWSSKILPTARRELRAFSGRDRRDAVEHFKLLREDSTPTEAKELDGFPGCYRIHVGKYHLIYKISPARRRVIIVGIPHRRIAYDPETLRRFRNPPWIPNPAERGAWRTDRPPF